MASAASMVALAILELLAFALFSERAWLSDRGTSS